MDPLLHFNGSVCAPGPEGSNSVTAVNRDITGSRLQIPAQNFQERRLGAELQGVIGGCNQSGCPRILVARKGRIFYTFFNDSAVLWCMLSHRFDDPLHETAVGGYASQA